MANFTTAFVPNQEFLLYGTNDPPLAQSQLTFNGASLTINPATVEELVSFDDNVLDLMAAQQTSGGSNANDAAFAGESDWI